MRCAPFRSPSHRHRLSPPRNTAPPGRDASHADRIDIPDAELLFRGHFARSGPDLVLTGQSGGGHFRLRRWPGRAHRRGKDRLGNISKRGDRYLRSLLTTGALAVIRYAKTHSTRHRPWLTVLLTRRPTKVAAIALANKIARIAWAMMAKGERYKEPAALAA